MRKYLKRQKTDWKLSNKIPAEEKGTTYGPYLCTVDCELSIKLKLLALHIIHTSPVPIGKSANPNASFTWMYNFCFLGLETSIWKSCSAKTHEYDDKNQNNIQKDESGNPKNNT